MEKLMMLMIVTTFDNLAHPNNVVKLVEVVNNPEEVCAYAEEMEPQL